MNANDLDLARRLAAVLGIWRAGMLDTLGRTVLAVRDGMCLCAWWNGPHGAERPFAGWVLFSDMGPPDLDDAATRGALLDEARERWGRPRLCVVWTCDGWWYPYDFDSTDGYHPILGEVIGETEGAAIALTILSAPEKTQ